MAVKIKTNQLAGYENTAFNYRFLNTTLTPLALIDEFHAAVRPNRKLGEWVANTYGKDVYLITPLKWNQELRAAHDADRVYRLLADEYYRTVEVKEKVDD